MALVGVGVVGVLLPVVPGFPFLLAAVAVLGPDHRFTRPIAGLLRRARSVVTPARGRRSRAVPRLPRSRSRTKPLEAASAADGTSAANTADTLPGKRTRGRRPMSHP